TNFGGVGARVGFQAYKQIKFEGEMSYDFDQAFTEGFTNTGTGAVTVQRSGLRVLHGEFGPRLNVGRHRIQPFVTLKGGLINFRFNSAPATVATLFSTVGGLRRDDVSGVFYPGGGLQGHLGPLGMRLDIGDEMYFNHGTHNNLRIAFGPTFRF